MTSSSKIQRTVDDFKATVETFNLSGESVLKIQMNGCEPVDVESILISKTPKGQVTVTFVSPKHPRLA